MTKRSAPTTRAVLRDQLGPTSFGPERRYVATPDVEMRAADDGDAGRLLFYGHAAVFNIRTWIGPKKWGFWEEIKPGAFAKTITDADVRMLKNHDPNFELARNTIAWGNAGALQLSEDSVGLVDEAEWIPTSYAQDLAISVRAGVLSQQSFGFLPVKEEWSTDENGDDVRALIEAQLFDVSPVTFPAFTETDGSLRAAQMGLLLEAAELPDTDTSLLVRALRTGTVTPDLAPTIRAAGEALGDLARRCEPAAATRDEGELDEDQKERAAAIRHAIRALAVTHAASTTR